ncbi:hypothetical protein [Asticcacaulis sp.]|uniref:hypothetical protein n=1 Tax=Asticcacaulis sp. TaxID=1872648 RepID=UPI003F7C645B
MIYVSYQPTVPGGNSGPIVQVQRCARIVPEKLSLPIVEVSEMRDDYGTNYEVVDGAVVPKV